MNTNKAKKIIILNSAFDFVSVEISTSKFKNNMLDRCSAKVLLMDTGVVLLRVESFGTAALTLLVRKGMKRTAEWESNIVRIVPNNCCSLLFLLTPVFTEYFFSYCPWNTIRSCHLCVSSPCCVADSSCQVSPAGLQKAVEGSGLPRDAGETSATELSSSWLHLSLLLLSLLVLQTALSSFPSPAWGSWRPEYVVFVRGEQEV